VKNGIPQVSVKDLKRRIDAVRIYFILDVREPFEYQIANIGGKLIPQNEVPQRIGEIDRNRRSLCSANPVDAASALLSTSSSPGYPKVTNLAGGILAWSDEVESQPEEVYINS
jgi:rhodanese-related sulfurtransferase